MKRDTNLEMVDELLREWGYFFRDRHQLNRCRSIEHRFQATSDDFSKEGWGDMESAPSVRPSRLYAVRRALDTHEAVQQLQPVQKWALTYAFCFPGLPKFVVLRLMKKWTGRRFNWKAYLEQLDIGRVRVYCFLRGGYEKSASI